MPKPRVSTSSTSGDTNQRTFARSDKLATNGAPGSLVGKYLAESARSFNAQAVLPVPQIPLAEIPGISRSTYPEYLRIAAILRTETVGGALLLVATAAALIWANAPAADGYFGLRDFKLGYEPWHLQLSLGHWASDGLLALFFFIAGLELKREFVSGDRPGPSSP